MPEQDDDRASRWEGHRYDAPESEETRRGKEWSYLALGLLVLTLMVLVATGVVPIFPG